MLLNELQIYNKIHNLAEWPIDATSLDIWLRDFLCCPHPALIKVGRPTAVCPFAEPAIDQGHLKIAHARIEGVDGIQKRNYLAKLIYDSSATFQESLAGESHLLDCLIVTLEGIDKHEWRYVMNGAYRDIKSEVLKMKLMVGVFHPVRVRTSRITSKLHPLRTPIPVIAIRHMIQSDWKTLTEKAEYLEIYDSFFDRELD